MRKLCPVLLATIALAVACATKSGTTASSSSPAQVGFDEALVKDAIRGSGGTPPTSSRPLVRR